MTEALISRLSDQGYNLVIEGTGRTTDVPIQTATMLQSKGYETKMYVTAVLKIESYLGTIERYETMYADGMATVFLTNFIRCRTSFRMLFRLSLTMSLLGYDDLRQELTVKVRLPR